MTIGFINLSATIFEVTTPYDLPLGGSESSLCYLAKELAKKNHRVFLFGHYQKEFIKKNVYHYPQKTIVDLGKDLDVLIIENTGQVVAQLKKFLNKKTKIIYWIHHDINQPDVLFLKEKELNSLFDLIIFVSHWQKERFLQKFSLEKKKLAVLKNCVAPFFEDLFKKNEMIISQKETLSFAYTSTPFRGLSLLVNNIFPEVVKKFPQAKLSVFSSLKGYQRENIHHDKFVGIEEYSGLYQAIKKNQSINYLGSIGQRDLAQKLKKIMFLIYPSTFEETSSISVLEGMASGCLVITSDLGALKETTAGFGEVISFTFDPFKYSQKFSQTVFIVLSHLRNNKKNFEKRLRKQVKFIKENYLWKKRASEWEKVFNRLLAS